MRPVKVYTTDYCPFCTAAINLLKGKDIPFEEIHLSTWEERNALVRQTGWPTVPQIFIGDEMIGGFEELLALDQQDQLEAKLAD